MFALLGCYAAYAGSLPTFRTFLRLESVALVLYLSVYSYLCSSNYSLFSVVLVFPVGEVSFGLSVMVSIIRSHGNDYLPYHFEGSSRLLDLSDR